MAVRVIRKLLGLLDVDADAITDGQVLVWDTDTSTFIPANNGSGGAAPTDATYITQTASANLSAEQALGDLATGLLKNTTTTGVLSIATEGTDYYKPSGTDVALADGGTGASLADPGADRIMFWDDSASSTAYLQAGSGLTLSGTVLTASGSLPAAGNGLTLTGTVLDVVVDDSTLEINADTLRVKDGGITAAKVAADVATQAELDAHINDTSAAHAASAVSFTPTGNLSSTDAQAAIAEAATDAASALTTHESDTTSVHGITDTSTLYRSGGTDVALADGGTGASLVDPNADRIFFWDDSAGATAFLQTGSGLTLSGTVLTASGGLSLADPNADRIVFWDDSAGDYAFLQAGTGLTLSGTVLTSSGGGSGSKAYPIQILNPRTTSLSGNSFFSVAGLTDWDAGHWEFVKDVDGKVYGVVRVPPAYSSGGTLRLAIAANATTGVTRLGVGTKAVADGESLNPTLTDETKQDITVPGTAYLRKDVTFTLTETLAADDLLIVEIFHEGSHANDTLAVNTLLLGAWLEVTA